MKRCETLYSGDEFANRYLTIYEDALGGFHYTFTIICPAFNSRQKFPIAKCTDKQAQELRRSYTLISHTHYVDPAGNLRQL